MQEPFHVLLNDVPASSLGFIATVAQKSLVIRLHEPSGLSPSCQKTLSDIFRPNSHEA